MKERLSLLSVSHRQLIQELIQKGRLPETIIDDLLTALYELSRDLQPVELDLKQLGDYLLGKGSALTEAELRTAVDDYINQITQGCQRDMVRIKIKID